MTAVQSVQEIILVLEGDVLIRMPIAQYLRDGGYRVIESVGADEEMTMLMHKETRVDMLFQRYRNFGLSLIDGVFGAAGFQPPRAIVKTISIELTTSLVASGESVRILPISVARLKAGQAAVRVLPIKSAGPRVSAEIVYVKNRTLNLLRCPSSIAYEMS